MRRPLLAEYGLDLPDRATISHACADGVFQMRHVYCKGRNQAGHAVETGHGPDGELLFFFQKKALEV